MAKEDHADLKNRSTVPFHEMVDLSNQRRITVENNMPITAAEAAKIAESVYAFNQNAYDNALRHAYSNIRAMARDGKRYVSLNTGIWSTGESDPKCNATFKAVVEQLQRDGFIVKHYAGGKFTEISW